MILFRLILFTFFITFLQLFFKFSRIIKSEPNRQGFCPTLESL
uniref:Uncharacterized protein n=1 Tax=Rhizophora mucronata TaxID=61149 RepID=A0A2P2P0P4_RHIMU